MSLTARLLAELPPDVLVVDCTDCGALATNEWRAFKQFRSIGLKLLGQWRPRRDGHRRPVCMACKQERPEDRLPHPTSWPTS